MKLNLQTLALIGLAVMTAPIWIQYLPDVKPENIDLKKLHEPIVNF